MNFLVKNNFNIIERLIKMSFGKRLAQARKNKGYKQKEIAEMFGVTTWQANAWEKDKYFPEVLIIKNLAKELDVSVEWLIGNENDYIK